MKLSLDGETHDIEIVARRPTLQCRVDGVLHVIEEGPAADAPINLQLDGRDYAVLRVADGARLHLKLNGRYFVVSEDDPLTAYRAGGDDEALRADMPGVVVAVRCELGAAVAAGDPLLTIESMKMQLTVSAPRAGVITAVHYGLNQAFQKGATLVALHPLTVPEHAA